MQIYSDKSTYYFDFSYIEGRTRDIISNKVILIGLGIIYSEEFRDISFLGTLCRDVKIFSEKDKAPEDMLTYYGAVVSHIKKYIMKIDVINECVNSKPRDMDEYKKFMEQHFK